MMARRSNETFAKGMEGESEVRRILKNLEGVTFIENLYLETATSTCQIDFIAISRKGVFVIEVKNITGTVTVNLENAKWRVATNTRAFSVLNPVLQNSRHILNLRKKLNIEHIYHNIVVFSEKTNILNRTPEVMNYLDLYSMEKNKLDILTNKEVEALTAHLNQLQKANMYLAVKHNRNAKKFLS